MTQKELAVKCLQLLGIYEPYVRGFETKGLITFFENGFGYYADGELLKKIREIEEEYGGMVYAATHELTEFGECYSFLWMSGYEEDREYPITSAGTENTFYVFAYVWNKTDDMFSEFGEIGVRSQFGGIVRIA